MTAATIRSRAPARRIPASHDDCTAAIERLKLLRSALGTRKAALDGQIATLEAAFAADIESTLAEARELEETIRLYCEAHRTALTNDGRRKTVPFGDAGSVSWRWRPASIEVVDEAIAIAALERAELEAACVITTRRVSKTAVAQLAPDRIATLDGVRLVPGIEDCVIKTVSRGASVARPATAPGAGGA